MQYNEAMKNKLLDDINNYIEYLSSLGLLVTVHGRAVRGLLEHNIHKSPFCALVKSDSDAWDKCVRCQQKVFNRYRDGMLFGMCHAGMEEYVFFVDSGTFVSVSGYGINRGKAIERMKNISTNFNIKYAELLNVYDSALRHEAEDEKRLGTLIRPLCHMISLFELMTGSAIESQSRSKTFDSVLSFVQRHFADGISLRTVAEACSCSESTVSHLFKLYKGVPLKKYITELRLKKAADLLSESDLSVTDIALLVGFSDANWFSSAFKKRFGASPSVFRRTAR